jgi:hypothetical protein
MQSIESKKNTIINLYFDNHTCLKVFYLMIYKKKPVDLFVYRLFSRVAYAY